MGKRRFTEDSWHRDPWFQALVDALLHSKTPEDMGNFLRDIATLSELQAWGERLEVAKLLAQGLSYREVAKRTGASTTTVTRVAKFIENGEGGYRKVLKTHRHHRMKVDVKQESEASHQEKSQPVSPLQKYLQR
jgi:TrpR-related protein YerC/YecD